MRISFIRLLWLLLPLQAAAQDGPVLTLETAWEEAVQQFPLTRQRALISRTASLSIENLSRGYLPQLSLSGQASYQSEVTRVSIPLPGVNIDPLSRDQYRAVLDVNQLLYDGGAIRQQQQLQRVQAAAEEEKIEVQYQQLKERIRQLYLGVLLLDEQMKQLALVQQDLQAGISRVEAQVQYGTAFRSALATLQAEYLHTEQRMVELRTGRTALLDMLGLFLNRTLSNDTRFVQPAVETPPPQPVIERSELRLLRLQDSVLQLQSGLIDVRNRPRVSLFVQGGYGRPGLNMLKNAFDPYYIAGVRFNWSLSGWYTSRREKEILRMNRQALGLQAENFLLQTNVQLKQQQAEINKYRALVATDDRIIALRTQVKLAAQAQLEQGVITAADYIREVNAEDQARLSKILHQLQLLQAQLNYQTITGK